MPDERLKVVKLTDSDTQTVKALTHLAEDARSGQVVGTVVVALYHRGQLTKQKRYSLTITGLASRDPTLASGAIGACKVLIDELALQEAGLLDD